MGLSINTRLRLFTYPIAAMAVGKSVRYCTDQFICTSVLKKS